MDEKKQTGMLAGKVFEGNLLSLGAVGKEVFWVQQALEKLRCGRYPELLPLEPDAFETAAVVAAMPAASSSVLVAQQYGGDYEFAGQAIIITTVLSLATIPLLLRFFL